MLYSFSFYTKLPTLGQVLELVKIEEVLPLPSEKSPVSEKPKAFGFTFPEHK